MTTPGLTATVITEQEDFPGRLGIQQRVLPSYRAAFFDLLASHCRGGLGLFAGEAGRGESIQSASQLEAAQSVQAGNLHFFNVGSPYYFLWQRGLITWLRQWDPEVLIIEANPRYLSNPRAIRWMHARRRPVIGWGLGAPGIADSAQAGFQRMLRRKLLTSCDALIAYSQRGAAEYGSQGFPAAKIFVAPNAVTPPPAVAPPVRPPPLDRRPVVLFIGRLQARKRLDNLLRACAALPAYLQPRLLIVGDGPARQEYQDLAKATYLHAEFAGPKHGVELEPFFQQADLFVLPGTGGLAVQEAMAHGLPVIVAEADGTQGELVRPENGWLIPPGDPAALQEALQEALSDPARLRRMGYQSYRIAAQEVNILAMAKVFLQAMRTVISLQMGP